MRGFRQPCLAHDDDDTILARCVGLGGNNLREVGASVVRSLCGLRVTPMLRTVSDHLRGWSLTLYGTMYLMAIRYDVPICECGSCGHRWLAESDRLPVRCPSRRCRSPQWNDAGYVEPVPVVKAKPARKLPAVSTASPATLARLAAVATHPPIGTKCPHGWANWLQCPKCHPQKPAVKNAKV